MMIVAMAVLSLIATPIIWLSEAEAKRSVLHRSFREPTPQEALMEYRTQVMMRKYVQGLLELQERMFRERARKVTEWVEMRREKTAAWKREERRQMMERHSAWKLCGEPTSDCSFQHASVRSGTYTHIGGNGGSVNTSLVGKGAPYAARTTVDSTSSQMEYSTCLLILRMFRVLVQWFIRIHNDMAEALRRSLCLLNFGVDFLRLISSSFLDFLSQCCRVGSKLSSDFMQFTSMQVPRGPRVFAAALELECVRFADLVMAWVNEAASSAADFMFSVLSLFDRFLLFSRSVRSELEACFLSFFAGPIGAYRTVEADLKSASEVIRGGFGKVVACTEIADQSVKLFCINHRIDQSKKHLERIFRGWKVEAAAVVNKVDIKYLFEAVAALSDACSFLLWIVLLLVLLSFEIVNFLGLFAGMSSGEKRKFRLAQQLFAACVFHVCCR